jgi:hypothetical protein
MAGLTPGRMSHGRPFWKTRTGGKPRWGGGPGGGPCSGLCSRPPSGPTLVGSRPIDVPQRSAHNGTERPWLAVISTVCTLVSAPVRVENGRLLCSSPTPRCAETGGEVLLTCAARELRWRTITRDATARRLRVALDSMVHLSAAGRGGHCAGDHAVALDAWDQASDVGAAFWDYVWWQVSRRI